MAKTALANAKKASYIGKKVVIAVKAGGDDPSINRQLAAVMKEANSLDVTKDVIDRNVKRAMQADTSDYKELVYEGYGHGGVGFIVNCLSDNNNRANTDVSRRFTTHAFAFAAASAFAFCCQSPAHTLFHTLTERKRGRERARARVSGRSLCHAG